MHSTSSGLLVLGHTGSLPDPPSLRANAILRLVLCPVALLSIWVPLSQLWRNGEFSACVFVVNNWAMVLIVFVNAALWHSQDFDSWWLGVGWCDLLTYVQYAMMTLFCSSACAIMRRLSKKVGLTRVSGLSARERRNNLLVQSLIMFPVPLLQALVTVFVSGERYRIAPVSGCTSAYYPNAIYLIFFLIPPPLFTIGACFHTIQTYRRFREIDASSRVTLTSAANTTTSLRRQRARRKLYFMILCMLVPYTPMITAFLVFDLIQGWPFHYAVDYHSVHVAGIVPWNSIALLSYADIGFVSMNLTWIPVVASFVSFIFFGTSKEAINMYRRTLVAVGLARCFPRLNEVYDPDRSRATPAGSPLNSTVSSTGTQLSTAYTACTDASSVGPWSRKGSLAPILPAAQRHLSHSHVDSGGSSGARGAGGAGDDSSVVQAPAPSAWRSGLRRLVTARPYAALMGQQRQRITSTDDMELESGRRQVPPVSFQDPFRDPIRDPGPEAFPPSFPLPLPASHPQQAPAHTAATPVRPVLNPGLDWTSPPHFQNTTAFALRRPSATADAAAAGDGPANRGRSPPGRLRRLFPLTASSSPAPAGEDAPIYDGRPAGASALPTFQTVVWSGAGSPKQHHQQKAATNAAAAASPVPRKPVTGGGSSSNGRGLAVPGETFSGAVVHKSSSAGTGTSIDHASEAAPSGVRVERTIVTREEVE